MIQTIVSCGRCAKLLEPQEGFELSVFARAFKFRNPLLNEPLPVNEQLCDGCEGILHFLLKDTFRETRVKQ